MAPWSCRYKTNVHHYDNIMKSSVCLSSRFSQIIIIRPDYCLKYTSLLFLFLFVAIKHDFFPAGGNCARHLWILGSAACLAGAAEPVPDPHGSTESADAAPRHAPTHTASRCADVGCVVAKRQHTKPRDHVLVLHPEAAWKHAQEPHRYGINASKNGTHLTSSLFTHSGVGVSDGDRAQASIIAPCFTSWAKQKKCHILMIGNINVQTHHLNFVLSEIDLVYLMWWSLNSCEVATLPHCF